MGLHKPWRLMGAAAIAFGTLLYVMVGMALAGAG